MKSDSRIKNRAVTDNIKNRFAIKEVQPLEDQWWIDDTEFNNTTELIPEHSKSIISVNQSPDVPFSQSINPYRGCEHGCIYCYARPTHAYWDFSPGYDFESKIIYKNNAVELLEKKFNSPSYRCQTIVIGANTDAYQPVEKELKITRQLLKLFLAYQHPVSIITKSQLIGRDLDLLTQLAEQNLVSVAVSVTTLENSLKQILEPRTSSPKARLKTIRRLNENNIPVTALIAPIIPAINDHELESMVSEVAVNGAKQVAYILLRLPHEVKPLFIDWLQQHYPLRKQKVLNLLQQMRQGQLNSPQFGLRMSGQGIFAQLLRQRFQIACQKAGIIPARNTIVLNTELFQLKRDKQLCLF